MEHKKRKKKINWNTRTVTQIHEHTETDSF